MNKIMDNPETQHPFLNPNSSTKNESIKENGTVPVNKRKPTNVGFLVLFGITVAIWLSLNFYCIHYGDLSRLNTKSAKEISGFFEEFAMNIKNSFGEICLACSSAVLSSILMIVLFRYFASTIIWFSVGLVLTVLTIGTLSTWVRYGIGDSKPTTYDPLFDVFVFTMFTIIIAVIIYFVVLQHIPMVNRLFEEGSKATQSIPSLLAQPFVTSVKLVFVIFLCLYFALWIESSRISETNANGDIIYRKNHIMVFASAYNFLVVWWIIQFLISCQHMVIAGATATWYFSRDKTRINNTITISYKNLLKFHLGSVALGSLIMNIVQILRTCYRLCSQVRNTNVIGCLLTCCLEDLVKFLNFVTRNTYIEIAIYGSRFYESGKRAAQVVTNNAIEVGTINSVCDFIMVLCRFAIAVLAYFIGRYFLLRGRSYKEIPGVVTVDDTIKSYYYPLIFIFVVSFTIAHAFMSALEIPNMYINGDHLDR
ncbi:choline transporter-like protein 1 isoform X2 [Planococcus citri]|uniref:choline transporter-like protein 1 isoform X2 n=1 Tax=Planococcus citri TaxID=170843 RepID=UPI0031F743C8